MKSNLAIFEDYKIRRLYDEETETWFFSVVDIIRALTQQPDFQAARNYWKVLKNRLNKEGSESVTKCNRLKLEAADGKKKQANGLFPGKIICPRNPVKNCMGNNMTKQLEPLIQADLYAFYPPLAGWRKQPVPRQRHAGMSFPVLYGPYKHC